MIRGNTSASAGAHNCPREDWTGRPAGHCVGPPTEATLPPWSRGWRGVVVTMGPTFIRQQGRET